MDKDGKIDRYYNLDEILKLDITQEIRKTINENFGKKVYFDSNGSCKIGKLIGLEKNYQLGDIYYIAVDSEDKKMFIPTHKSISTL